MLLYYITDRRQFPGNPDQQRECLLAKIAEATRAGVDLIQLRERDLSGCELFHLAEDAVRIIRETRNPARETRLLINSRLDVALAAGADGVHLRSDDISVSDVLAVSRKVKREARNEFLCAVSCHTPAEVRLAQGADYVVYAPVFEKPGTNVPAAGLEGLRKVCGESPIPILALGGVNLDNARDCIRAGAAGIAGIRLFQDHKIEEIISVLR